LIYSALLQITSWGYNVTSKHPMYFYHRWEDGRGISTRPSRDRSRR